MPCDTITRVQLKLKPEIVRADWLKAVVENFGHSRVTISETRITWDTGYYDRKTGTLVERTLEQANRIRQSYAAELTRRTLGRAGWQVRTEAHNA